MIQRLWQCGLGVLLLLCACQSYAKQVVYPINQYCNVHVLSISSAKTASHNKKHKTGWENVQLPDVWDERWKNYNGGAWYKIEWDWFCERDHRLNQPIVFALDFLNSAGAVYLNQRLPILEKSIFIVSLAVIVCVFLTPLDYVKLVFSIVFLSYASLLVVVYF
nr:hypothetical protein [uncultured Acinetobacter sp.]